MERTKTRIALLIDYVTSDYSKIILSGMKAACVDLDAELLIFPIGQLNRFQSPFDYQMVSVTSLLSKNNIDGIIIESSSQMKYLTKTELSSYVKSYKPLKMVSISTVLANIPSIVVDCEDAYRVLFNDLINVQKCRKFGILGVKTNSTEVKDRTKNIKEILTKNNIPPQNITLWKASFEYNKALKELNLYYDNHNSFDFDTLIAFNDEMAMACLDFCDKIGKKVPEEVVITGFDDIERAKLVTPALTSINQQIFEQGYKAVELLNKSIHGEEIPAKTIIKAKTILRESSQRYKTKTQNSEFLKIEEDDSDGRKKFLGQNEWFAKKNQVYQLTKFYTDMQYDMSLSELEKRINQDVKNFGISAMAIVIYDTPIETATPFEYFNLPHKAFVFSAFDYSTGVDINASENRINFDPNEVIVPENILKIDGNGQYVLSLYHNTLQYGYMVFRFGDLDYTIYDLVSKIISTIISSVYSFDLIGDTNAKMKIQNDRLNIVANSDELTGLYNRRGLFDFGQSTLQLAKARKKSGIIVYCDIDGLKKINDTYGHEAGDRAIIAESIILKGNFRSSDIIARIGGDEFAIISLDLTEKNLKAIKEHIEEDCRIWTETNKDSFKLSISMGYVEFPSNNSSYQLTGLMSEADELLYVEKRIKKSNKD